MGDNKRFYTLCAFFILMLTLCFSIKAEALGTTQTEKVQSSSIINQNSPLSMTPMTRSLLSDDKHRVKVGYIPGFGIVRDLNSIEQQGFIHQIFKRIEENSFYQFIFIPYSSEQDLYEALNRKKVDVIGPVVKGEGDPRYTFSYGALGIAQVVLATKEEDEDTSVFFYDDPQTIDGKTVASYHGSPYEKILDEYCKKHNITVQYVRSSRENYSDLEADLYLISTLYDEFLEFHSVLNLSIYEYFMAFLKENYNLSHELFLEYVKVIASDGKLMHELYFDYYNQPNLTRRSLTRSERSELQGKKFKVGYVENHPPLQFTNEDGIADGITIEIFNLLAQRYGFEAEYIPYYYAEPWEYREKVDFLLTLVGDYDYEHEFYQPTDSYLEMPLMLITSHSDALAIDFTKDVNSIGMLNYITFDKQKIYKEFPKTKLKIYENLEDLLIAYQLGEVDALLVTNSSTNYIVDVIGNTYYNFGTELTLPFRLFVSRNLGHEYTKIFNVIFDHINQGEFNEVIAKQSMLFLPTHSFLETIRMYIVELVFFFITLVGMLISFVLYGQNKRKQAVLDAVRYDELTGFLSFNFFEKAVEAKLQTLACDNYEIISLDVDSFKTITTYYNYEKATEVLVAIGKGLDEGLKQDDALITRVAADHFIVFRNHFQRRKMQEIIERHVKPKTQEVLGENYHLSFSVGTYKINSCAEKINVMIDFAKLARTKGKEKHQSTYYLFDEKMMKEYNNKLNITFRMEKALKDKEFKLVFQPKVDFKTLKVRGAEALVRWVTKSGDTIYPSDFIHVFEQNGFISNLDLYVFTKVCHFIREYDDMVEIPLISSNLSGRTMIEDDIVQNLKRIVEQVGIDPKRVELEITESAIVEDHAMKKVKELQDIGFTVSIDDFGAGVSSLNRLGSVEADTLKLDKAFLDGFHVSKRNEIVIQDTIRMAKHLNIKTVAEGVETAEQANWLRSLGCDIAQGYYFAKPMSVEEFLALLVTKKTFYLEGAEELF